MDFEKQSLKFLGFSSKEEFEKLKITTAESYQTTEALVEEVPHQLLMMAPFLLSENYADELANQLPLPLHPEFVDQLHQIVSEHLSWIPKHPFYATAAKLVLELRSEKNADRKNLPCRSIESASCSPMLSGFNPPFLPLVRVKVDDSENQSIISDLFTWPDMLFLASILLGSVGSHAEASSSLISESKTISVTPPERIQELVDQSRQYLDLIETHLCSTDATCRSQ